MLYHATPINSENFVWLLVAIILSTCIRKSFCWVGRGWWREQEEPWQTLACCRELASALSFFPVHQDGSCNGLQHYAAMGRDERGAVSVSLRDCERPRDVYGDVTEVVGHKYLLKSVLSCNLEWRALEGFVQRKVIKQSVMTTVYGVTLYGAMSQIRRQLKEIPEFPRERWLGPASAYLARLTLASISAIFTSSSETQAWFGRLSRHITKDLSCRISWVTPLGLPVVQPYVKSAHRGLEVDFWSGSSQRQLLDYSALTRAAALAEKSRTWKGAKDSLVSLPAPNPLKQKNAFPPNFIHSLDSCHMMLTALHCFREGILFASVHDCFWTHAASVDRMNRVSTGGIIALPLLSFVLSR
ncbi:unnamed protein product [Schistocephalus solidus]|uniref:DNA-directed RNA polymerase n=1 Tax=Schistocephalus solidus TaxID=70667 RepID=A0A183SDC0_SCHSO|nr:unnamed protein product [Schistocephalus solidus]